MVFTRLQRTPPHFLQRTIFPFPGFLYRGHLGSGQTSALKVYLVFSPLFAIPFLSSGREHEEIYFRLEAKDSEEAKEVPLKQ